MALPIPLGVSVYHGFLLYRSVVHGSVCHPLLSPTIWRFQRKEKRMTSRKWLGTQFCKCWSVKSRHLSWLLKSIPCNFNSWEYFIFCDKCAAFKSSSTICWTVMEVLGNRISFFKWKIQYFRKYTILTDIQSSQHVSLWHKWSLNWNWMCTYQF